MDKGRFLKDIGIRLRKLRSDRTQESICVALSKLLGAERTKEAYQHYEAGRRLVPADVLWGLSEIYNVSSDWILRGGKSLAGKKNVKEPGIIFYRSTHALCDRIQSLPKKEREAVKVIIDVIVKRSRKKLPNA